MVTNGFLCIAPKLSSFLEKSGTSSYTDKDAALRDTCRDCVCIGVEHAKEIAMFDGRVGITGIVGNYVLLPTPLYLLHTALVDLDEASAAQPLGIQS